MATVFYGQNFHPRVTFDLPQCQRELEDSAGATAHAKAFAPRMPLGLWDASNLSSVVYWVFKLRTRGRAGGSGQNEELVFTTRLLFGHGDPE